MFAANGRSLRIAVLSHALRVAGGASVGRNLAAALCRAAPHHRYLFVVPEGIGYEEAIPADGNFETVPYCRRGGLAGRWLFDTFRLPSIIGRFRPDVLLSLNNRGLRRPLCPQALLCHDAHLFYPRRHYAAERPKNKLLKAYHKRGLRGDLRHTGQLFCQTEVAARRLREAYGYAGPVAIVSNAVSYETLASHAAPPPTAAAELVRGKWALFCLARYYPHKNLEAIVETFDCFRQELQGVIGLLTISREDHPKAAGLLRLIERRGLGRQIVNVGPIPQERLAGYYRLCKAMLLPTLLESFSGTYLEAMTFGTPILTSDLDFAQNVCGDAALYFDPWDVGSIKDAILQLKNDGGLQRTLADRGRRRVEGAFRSWDQVAADLIGHLESLVSCPKQDAVRRRDAPVHDRVRSSSRFKKQVMSQEGGQ